MFLCIYKKPRTCIYLNSTVIKVLRCVVCFMFQAIRFCKNEEGNAVQCEFTNNPIQV